MENMTIAELRDEAKAVCRWLIDNRGYDSAEFHWFNVHDDMVCFEFSFEDDFQKEATNDQRYYSGRYQSIRITPDETLYGWAASLPTRRQREIAFTIRQLRPIAAAAEQVKDLEIQKIMQGILGANSSLHNLLEHKPESNDEIPF